MQQIYTIKQVIKILAKHKIKLKANTLLQQIYRKNINAKKFGRDYVLNQETVNKLIKKYEDKII